MNDTVLARLAALKTTPTIDLKQQWRDLFETEPPPYNRRFLEHRLAYRIQELDISQDGADIRLRTEGLASLVTDLRAASRESRSAA